MDYQNDSSFGASPAVAADPGPASAIAVLYAPVKTFLGLAARPRILVPLLLVLLFTGLGSAVVMSKIDPDDQRATMREAFEKQGFAGQQLEERVDKAAEFMAKFGLVFAAVGVVFVGIILLLFGALLFGGLKLAGAAGLTFRQALSITLHSAMPMCVAQLIAIPVALGRESISMVQANSGNILASNLGFLASEETGAAMRALLSSVDVFSLWGVVLTALGGSVIGRLSRGTAATVAIVIWVLGVLLRVGFASLQG